MQMESCDCLVVGGSLGGVAAAVALAEQGWKVCLTEETDWLGGQATSQGVSALDEFGMFEHFGAPASYMQFRQGIRNHYRENYTLSEKGRAMPHLNPGNGWVSRVCYEPKVAVDLIKQMTQKHIDNGTIRVFHGYIPTKVDASAGRIHQVEVVRVGPCSSDRQAGDKLDACDKGAALGEASPTRNAKTISFQASMVLDATELGDLLPLAGIPYVSGTQCRAETGELHAYPGEPHPEWVQSFTYTFAVEFRPGEDHTIPKPDGYEYFRDTQPYTFNLYSVHKGCRCYPMFPATPGEWGFWNYRRLIDSELFDDKRFPNDLAMINWPGNDYDRQNLIDKPREEQLRIREEAKLLSLGFLYWLQTEAPRDGGGYGYPELKLRPDVMGTEDGLSKYPYIRESRRIRAMTTVKEEHLSEQVRPEVARADLFFDTVGLGSYFIDIHACSGGQKFSLDIPARYYQIPLGALLAPGWKNFLPACKNIGVTHIANGSYREHPVEWSLGEAAGKLVGFCLAGGHEPHEVREDPRLLHQFQMSLVETGAPLFWYSDVPDGHPAWKAVQYLSAVGIIVPDETTLEFHPDAPSDENTAQWEANFRRLTGLSPQIETTVTRAEWAQAAYKFLTHKLSNRTVL